MTASRSARERKAASEAGPLATAKIELDAHRQFAYKLSCSACAVPRRANWSTYRPGGDNGFVAAIDRWIFHLASHQPEATQAASLYSQDMSLSQSLGTNVAQNQFGSGIDKVTAGIKGLSLDPPFRLR